MKCQLQSTFLGDGKFIVPSGGYECRHCKRRFKGMPPLTPNCPEPCVVTKVDREILRELHLVRAYRYMVRWTETDGKVYTSQIVYDHSARKWTAPWLLNGSMRLEAVGMWLRRFWLCGDKIDIAGIE